MEKTFTQCELIEMFAIIMFNNTLWCFYSNVFHFDMFTVWLYYERLSESQVVQNRPAHTFLHVCHIRNVFMRRNTTKSIIILIHSGFTNQLRLSLHLSLVFS